MSPTRRIRIDSLIRRSNVKYRARRRHAVRASCFLLAAALTTLTLAVHAQGTGPVIYPAKGQAPGQQDRDRYECHDWARSQSGFDPTQAGPPMQASATGQLPASGASFGTMARGAASGAAIAELTDHDTGRGAAAGLLGASAISRGRDQRAMQARQQQQAAQQQAARGAARSTYDRGFAACMEARGYVVK
jgi:hypothetical protein